MIGGTATCQSEGVERRREKGWSLGKMGKCFFQILLVMRHFGAVSPASDNVQNGDWKMKGTQWEKEMVRDSWVEEVDRGKFQTFENEEQEWSQKPSTQLVPC